MSRPGCVWTHSLIVDLTCLDDTFDFRQLLSYFHRPANDEYSYGKPIEFDATKVEPSIKDYNYRIEEIWTLYKRLLQKSVALYSVENTSDYYQNLLLTLLQYLPVDVVKVTRLCSGGTMMRKDGTYEFNLLFSSVSGRPLSTVSVNKGDDSQSSNCGIYFICDSLCHSNNDISQLIRFFSHDVGDNAIKINSLGCLLNAIDKAYKGKTGEDYKSLLQTIVQAFPSSDEGENLKRLFFGIKIGCMFTNEEDYYIQLYSLPEGVFSGWDSIGLESSVKQYISSSSDKFISLLTKLVALDSMNEEGKKAISNAANIVALPLLKDLCENHWDVFMALLSVRTELLCNDFWLTMPINKLVILLHNLENVEEKQIAYWDKLLTCILTNAIDISPVLANRIHANYPQTIADILGTLQSNSQTKLSYALDNLCVQNTEEVIHWVGNTKNFSVAVIAYLMRIVSPTSNIVKNMGVSYWSNFFNTESVSTDINYNIFLFRLALNWNSPIALNALKKSFYNIHVSLSKDELTYKEISLIRPYMEDLPFWQNWDNCKKLRKGVVKAMKRLSYTHNDIEHFTPSEELNTLLLKTWDK
jgi:hypothetical protein